MGVVLNEKKGLKEMKEFTFSAWCRFGKGDSGETEVEVELTDDEAERLVHYGTQPDVYYGGFYECKELSDIYQKVYAVAVKQITEELKDYEGFTLTEEQLNDPNWEADDLYACGVNFPSEFENLIE